jgi:hypothetical protein
MDEVLGGKIKRDPGTGGERPVTGMPGFLPQQSESFKRTE